MEKLMKIKPKKIAIFRALQLGDLLCTIPAIRSLKKALPNSEITLVGLPWAEEFTKRFSNYFSRFINFPGFPGLPEQGYDYKNIMHFIQKMNEEKFDLIIQLQGNGSIVNPLIEILGAKTTAGYYQENFYCPDKNYFHIYPEKVSEIERHIQLMGFLGIPSQGTELEFPIQKNEEEQFKSLCLTHKLNPKKYVCIHPGARDSKRWWDAEKFSMVADKIASQGYTIILTGTKTEKHIAKIVEEKMKYPAINLAGQTDLGTLAVLIKNAKMILSNDTGVSHIASAVETSSVVVFLSSDPERWAPLNKKLHHSISVEQSNNIEHIIEKTEFILSIRDGLEELESVL
jgi:ADP-heptose:LPS heptosyltransferase